MNQTDLSQELVLKYELWKVLREIVPIEVLSSTPQSNREILFRNRFSIPLCLSYENCQCPRRNHTSKRENCYAIFIEKNLQFSYQFAILTFWCMVPPWTFVIFVWVCNFHISLQFSCHDSNTSYVSALLVLLELDDLLLYSGNVLLPDVYISGIDSGHPSLCLWVPWYLQVRKAQRFDCLCDVSPTFILSVYVVGYHIDRLLVFCRVFRVSDVEGVTFESEHLRD